MPIKGYNFGPVIFLTELTTQCSFAKVSFERLQQAAPAWYSDAPPDQFAGASPPRDIMINCTAFLSAASVISKTLFEGKRKGKVARRCTRMRKLLELNDLPTLRNLSVRNAFEHIDERLDEIFSRFEGGRVAPLSVREEVPADDAVVLKRFDPKRLVVAFADVGLSLGDCMHEIQEVESRVNPAFKKLKKAKFDLWAA